MIQYIESNLQSLMHLLPEGIWLAAFVILFLLELFRTPFAVLWVLHLIFVALSVFFLWQEEPSSELLFGGLWKHGSIQHQFRLVLALSGVLFSFSIKSRSGRYREYLCLFPLMLLACSLTSMSNNLLSMFMSIELLSIISYIFIAYDLKEASRVESAGKYILFGFMSSAIMLFGMSWLYGLAGTLDLNADFVQKLSAAPSLALSLSLLGFLAGIFFKISTFPFHYYIPDIFEGSKPRTLSFISILPKLAAFTLLYAFLQHFVQNWHGTAIAWPHFDFSIMLALLSIGSLALANFSALLQSNLKRLMAYSSISHTGFLLIGLLNFQSGGFEAILFYSLSIIISNVLVFLLIDFWERAYEVRSISDLHGMAYLHPWLSFLVIIALASLVGLPPLMGFTAKFLLFGNLIQQYQQAYQPWLLAVMIAAVLSTVISLFYYFGILKQMYLRNSETRMRKKMNFKTLIIITLMGLLLVVLGAFPTLCSSLLRP